MTYTAVPVQNGTAIGITQTAGGTGQGFTIFDNVSLRTVNFAGQAWPNPKSINTILNIPYMLDVPGNDSQGFTLYVETGPVSLMWVSSIFVGIPELGGSVLDSNGSRDVVKRVPVVSDPGTILYDDASIHSKDFIDVSGVSLKQFHVSLTDENGNNIHVPNSWSVSITFSAHD